MLTRRITVHILAQPNYYKTSITKREKLDMWFDLMTLVCSVLLLHDPWIPLACVSPNWWGSLCPHPTKPVGSCWPAVGLCLGSLVWYGLHQSMQNTCAWINIGGHVNDAYGTCPPIVYITCYHPMWTSSVAMATQASHVMCTWSEKHLRRKFCTKRPICRFLQPKPSVKTQWIVKIIHPKSEDADIFVQCHATTTCFLSFG